MKTSTTMTLLSLLLLVALASSPTPLLAQEDEMPPVPLKPTIPFDEIE